MDLQYGALFKIDDVKAADNGWLVEGYVSTFGNVDHGGDVVMRGAFDALDPSKVKFLYQHQTDQVLGVAKSLKADDKGLFGTFKISKTALGEDVHTLLKDGALDSFSIGFIPSVVEFDDVGTRLLKAMDLKEASIVSFPMNELAGVTRVKADLPFVQMLERSIEHLKLGTEEAKALQARRASEKRELTEAQVAALTVMAEEVKALQAALDELLTAPTSEVPGDLKLRLQLARSMAIRRGHLEEVA